MYLAEHLAHSNKDELLLLLSHVKSSSAYLRYSSVYGYFPEMHSSLILSVCLIKIVEDQL